MRRRIRCPAGGAGRTRAERLATKENGRALADHEIVALWHAADAGNSSFDALVQMALLTGMRRGELADLTWQDVGSDRLTLHADATKSGAPHAVPLTPLMRLLLARQKRSTAPYIFPTVTGPRRKSWSLPTDELRKASGVYFEMHDTRRTCRTLMSRCDIPEADAELAIGHQRVGLVKLYNRDEAWGRRTAAFEAVDRHISGLLNATHSDKVVALKQGR